LYALPFSEGIIVGFHFLIYYLSCKRLFCSIERYGMFHSSWFIISKFRTV
jgi:hypothetical protein